MEKVETKKVTSYVTDKMIDVVKFMEEEPELFEELCTDFPAHKGRHVIDVLTKKEMKARDVNVEVTTEGE